MVCLVCSFAPLPRYLVYLVPKTESRFLPRPKLCLGTHSRKLCFESKPLTGFGTLNQMAVRETEFPEVRSQTEFGNETEQSLGTEFGNEIEIERD
jgi:hypothetical protein